MCFSVSLKAEKKVIEERFEAKFIDKQSFYPAFFESAFSLPIHPVILNEDITHIQKAIWGLIPFWAKDRQTADKIRFKTFNARAETLAQKPSFKNSFNEKRCLVLIDGFFEWREFKGKKYPYYIYMKGGKPFALAGLWDNWTDKQTGEIKKTFSIITCKAGPLLAKIHNTKLRMPVILEKSNEKRWLSENLSDRDKTQLLQPYEHRDLKYHTISHLITKRGVNKNTPEIIENFEYPELRSI